MNWRPVHKDHDRNSPQRRIGADFAQSFPTVFAGHVQIEKNQPRLRCVGTGVFTAAIQEIEQLLPVFDKVQLIRKPALS
jgi:hypothetical protein